MQIEAMEIRKSVFRGLDTAWLETGKEREQAPIILFLHGYPDTAYSWAAQLDYFGREYHAVAPFARGAGPSVNARDVARYGRTSAAIDNLDILNKIDPSRQRPVIVVGHDLGVVHAWTLARLLGSRLKALVTINGLDLVQMAKRLRSQPRQWLKSWYMPVMQVPGIPELLTRSFPDRILAFAYQQGGLAQPSGAPLNEQRSAVAGPLNQYRAFLRAIPQALREKLRPLDAPVLVLWGAQDAFLEPPQVAEFEPYAHDVRIRILEGNHWLHREKPADINELIKNFVDSELEGTHAH